MVVQCKSLTANSRTVSVRDSVHIRSDTAPFDFKTVLAHDQSRSTTILSAPIN